MLLPTQLSDELCDSPIPSMKKGGSVKKKNYLRPYGTPRAERS